MATLFFKNIQNNNPEMSLAKGQITVFFHISENRLPCNNTFPAGYNITITVGVAGPLLKMGKHLCDCSRDHQI